MHRHPRSRVSILRQNPRQWRRKNISARLWPTAGGSMPMIDRDDKRSARHKSVQYCSRCKFCFSPLLGRCREQHSSYRRPRPQARILRRPLYRHTPFPRSWFRLEGLRGLPGPAPEASCYVASLSSCSRFLSSPQAQAKHPFTFEDMMQLKRVGEPTVSPDSKLGRLQRG